jgi:hypothetical protein
MRKKETLRRSFGFVVAAGASGLGGAGMILLGQAGAAVLGGLLLLALLAFTSAVIFSSRDEPSKRLRKLIKAFWRGR